MKAVVTVKSCGTIRDLQAREDLTLVTDTQEVQQVKNHFGNHPDVRDFDGFFVKIHEGEYEEVIGFEGNVPYLHKAAYCVALELKEEKSNRCTFRKMV